MCYLLRTLVAAWPHSSSELPVLKDFWDVRGLGLGFLALLRSRLLSGNTDKGTRSRVQYNQLSLLCVILVREKKKAGITCTLR